MDEQITSVFDTFVKVWAILGPLIAAVASALWSRHILIGDREFERTRDKERAEHEIALKHQEHNETIKREKYNEVKMVIADFMASTHEYVRKQSEYLTNPIPEIHQAATAANDKFVYSCQIITLLGNDALSSAAITLWNATLEIPKSYNFAFTPEYEEKLRVYKQTRVVFNETARAYLKELEISTYKLSLSQTLADTARLLT